MRVLDIEQGTYEWHAIRSGMVTGTTLKSAVGSKAVQKTLMNQLIAERMTEPEIRELNSEAVERGKELEPIALKEAAKKTGEDYQICGMLISEEIDGFGLSPDGVVWDQGEIVGGIEIKCPDSKKHVEYLLGDAIPKDYLHQVLAPFVCGDEVQWWDFCSFDDRNYERPIFMTRIHRKDIEEAISEAREGLANFLERVNQTHLELTF